MERAKVPDSSLSLTLRNKKTELLKNRMVTSDLWLKKKRNITLSDLQKLAVGLCARVKPPLSFLPGDFSVVPGHLLVGRGGNQFLQLRSLTDDSLLHCFSLSRRTTKRQKTDRIHTMIKSVFTVWGIPNGIPKYIQSARSVKVFAPGPLKTCCNIF